MAARKRTRLVVEGPAAFVSIGGGADRGVVGVWVEATTAVRGGRAAELLSALDGPVRVTIVIEPREAQVSESTDPTVEGAPT